MPGETQPPKGYRFGVFEVDLAAGTVRREGLQVRLRGKPFDILVFLLERPGELVSRDDLRQRLWAADTFVDFDHGVNAAMNRLRDALGDSAESPRFIQTIPRRGYRFIAPVERIPAAAVPDAVTPPPAQPAVSPLDTEPRHEGRLRARPILAAAALVVLAAAGVWMWMARGRTVETAPARKMIAVLPFENLSGDPEQMYFTQGITEELIAQLGALNPDALGVIARTTAARYAENRASIRDIGEALGVQYVLEGSVRKSGSNVRITAQLIDAVRQTQLWSETYDDEVGDVLLTQRDVAMRVADALAMSVLGTPSVPRMRSPAAYESYLRGRFLRQQGTHDSLLKARDYFAQAIAEDPGYAAAHAGLADVYHVIGGPGWEFQPPREIMPLALRSAAKAIELDKQLADGYAVRGMSRLWFDWDPDAAEQDLRRAIALNASFALAYQYLSTALVVQGHTDAAIAAARRAAHLDPLSPTSGTTLGYRLYYAGKYKDAVEQFARVLEIAPAFASAHLGQSQALRELGRSSEAAVAVRRALDVAGGRTYIRAHYAYAAARQGRTADAREILRDMQELSRQQYVAPYDFALIAAGLGDVASLRSHLERAFDERSGWIMFVPLEREFAPYRDALSDFPARAGQRPASH